MEEIHSSKLVSLTPIQDSFKLRKNSIGGTIVFANVAKVNLENTSNQTPTENLSLFRSKKMSLSTPQQQKNMSEFSQRFLKKSLFAENSKFFSQNIIRSITNQNGTDFVKDLKNNYKKGRSLQITCLIVYSSKVKAQEGFQLY
jgi:hypothetical protein